jgi:hypothetical protein
LVSALLEQGQRTESLGLLDSKGFKSPNAAKSNLLIEVQ